MTLSQPYPDMHSKPWAFSLPFNNEIMNRTKIPRKDAVTAIIIERGIQLQKTSGTETAAKFLKANNIPLHIVLRVLNRPNERRQYR